MKRRYLFQHTLFRVVWVSLFAAVYLLSEVQVHSDIAYDVFIGNCEPVWHLLLRYFGVLSGGEFARYEPSLQPLLVNLPYLGISFILTTAALVAAEYLLLRRKKDG